MRTPTDSADIGVHHSSYGLSLNQLDIVYVDDSKPMRELMIQLLFPIGAQRLRIFDNPREALPKMLAAPPNLVITDWIMGDISGTDMIRIMRSPRFGAVAVAAAIVLTGLPQERLIKECLLAGVNQILTKPISPDDLRTRIKWVTHDDRRFQLSGERFEQVGATETLERIARDRPISGSLDELLANSPSPGPPGRAVAGAAPDKLPDEDPPVNGNQTILSA